MSCHSAHITHIQIVRRVGSKDSYCAMIRFTDAGKAALFAADFCGKQFNSLEPGTYRVAAVGHVAFQDPGKRTREKKNRK